MDDDDFTAGLRHVAEVDGVGAIGVDDVEETCKRLRDYGAEITREPGPMGDTGMMMAFAEDPDGYLIELLEDDTFPMDS